MCLNVLSRIVWFKRESFEDKSHHVNVISVVRFQKMFSEIFMTENNDALL